MFALLGPNGAGKTTVVHILSTLIAADAGEVRIAGFDVVREPNAVRGTDRPHRPGLGGRRPVHGRGEPAPDGRPLPPRQGGGSSQGRRAAGAVRPRRRRRQARDDLLGRHAPAPGPGDDPRRRPADHLPRRAHDRPRPPQPAGDVGHRPRARRRRRHDPAHDPVPRGGRPPREPDRAARRRPGRRPGHAGRAQAARARRQRPARVRRRGGARPGRRRRSATARATTRVSRSTCRTTAACTPCARSSTGSTRTPSRSTRSRSAPPTSTTCSSPSPAAATASPTKGCRPHDRLRHHRLDHHAPAEPPPDAPLPIADVLRRRHARRVPAAVRLRVRRDPRGGARRCRARRTAARRRG